MEITEADRQAAQALRVKLADICGFWHKPGDDSPLCLALAEHRIEAERRLAEQMAPIVLPELPVRDERDLARVAWSEELGHRIPRSRAANAGRPAL